MRSDSNVNDVLVELDSILRDVFGISSEDSDSNTSSNDEMNILRTSLLKGNLSFLIQWRHHSLLNDNTNWSYLNCLIIIYIKLILET